MWLNILFFIGGLVLILWGANALTDGASAVAHKFGISEFIIGMTIVGFGTSMPEFTVSLFSAFDGAYGIAIGNAVGSNIINILLIIGVTAIIMPISIEKNIMSNEIVLLIISSIILLVMGNGVLLDGASENILSRIDGILLLLFFFMYFRNVLKEAKRNQPAETAEGESSIGAMSPLKASIFIVLGLAALIFGADKFVDGAAGIARAFGVSDAVIGLTIVAIGTSLPELATSISSALKGRCSLAVGNVVGSNIFNIFFVLGATASIHPLPFGAIGNVDLLVMLGASVLFYLVSRFYKTQVITRGEGIIMVLCYVAYTVYLLVK